MLLTSTLLLRWELGSAEQLSSILVCLRNSSRSTVQAALVLFIWPRLYEEKQKEIDHYYALAMANVEKYIQLGLSKLPPAVTNKFPALKPKAQ